MRWIISCCLFLASAAQAGVFETQFTDLGPYHDTCTAKLHGVIDRFGDLTGAQVLDYGCQVDDVLSRHDGVIVYVAEARLNRVSSYTPSYRADALYDSEESCAASLPLQEDLLYAATGIEAVVSYCMADTYRRRFTSRVDGFGITNIRARTLSARFQYGLTDTDAALVEMKDALQQVPGLTIAEIGTAPDMTWGNLVVARVYSEEAFTFDNYDDLLFASPSECETARTTLAGQILADVDRVFAFCSVNSRTEVAYLHVVSIHNLLTRNDVLSIRRLPRGYESMSACAQFASSLSDRDQGIYGALCGFSDDQYFAHVFTAPTR